VRCIRELGAGGDIPEILEIGIRDTRVFSSNGIF
jgi:hypothetical protein